MDLTVDRVGAGSLTRANSRVTDREGERYRGCRSERYDRGVSAARSLRMRRARSRAPLWPYSKRATSLRLEECGNRLSRSCISILPSDTGQRLARAYARTHTQTHIRRTYMTAFHNIHRALCLRPSRSLSFSRSLYLGHTHTPRTNDTASYNTRASNIIGPILPPREINVST